MYICGNCGERCDIYEMNESTPVEFWGYNDNHTESWLLSTCCQENVNLNGEHDIRCLYRWEDVQDELDHEEE